MPAHARHMIFNPKVIGFYHCTARCVGRLFLCGKDRDTGKGYEHRKEIAEERLARLRGWANCQGLRFLLTGSSARRHRLYSGFECPQLVDDVTVLPWREFLAL